MFVNHTINNYIAQCETVNTNSLQEESSINVNDFPTEKSVIK